MERLEASMGIVSIDGSGQCFHGSGKTSHGQASMAFLEDSTAGTLHEISYDWKLP